MKAALIGSRELAPNTRHFEFEAADWGAAFVPGQFLSLTQVVGGDPVTRAYSIASEPGEGRFALCANLVSDGRFSPFLFGLEPGETIDFKGPYGAFILRRPVADSIMVATGTGIAPFRSMLRAKLAEHTDRRFTLIFGVRHQHGLLYDDEWTALAKQYPNFRYCPTLTRPDGGWTGLTGRVQQHALDELERMPRADVYICGLREMVDDLRLRLKQLIDRKRIIYEKYD